MNLRILFYKIRGHFATFFIDFLPDDLYLMYKYAQIIGKPLNIKKPKTFCEKINWLKIHGFKQEYTQMVDKVDAKEFVASKIGIQYIIPTIAIWNSIEDIDWAILPNQFVMKCSHDSGGVVVCTDKKSLDRKSVISKIDKCLKKTFSKYNKEKPYEYVKPRIIVEEYLTDNHGKGDLTDFKFYCFGGNPKYCQVIRNRNTAETIDFYDMQWKHMPFIGLDPKASFGTSSVPMPQKLDEMINICQKLSAGIPFVRVDLYYVMDKVFFGEITFYPNSGFGRFIPTEWNLKLGDLIKL